MEIALAGYAVAMAGALLAGLVSGLAGFGTGLIAAGIWLHVMPATVVPSLVVLTSVAGQLMGLALLRRQLDWRGVSPYLLGGVIGVPIGVMILAMASPAGIRLAIGVFLLGYAAANLAGWFKREIGNRGGRPADMAVGTVSGALGGFAGLSGALPLVWLQLRGGPVRGQRAIYQPFNLVILSLAALAMLAGGQIPSQTWGLFLACLPMTLAGSWLGIRWYARIDDGAFRRVVLILLCVSGLILCLDGLVP